MSKKRRVKKKNPPTLKTLPAKRVQKPQARMPAFDAMPPAAVDGIMWPPLITGRGTAALTLQVQFDMSQWWKPQRILGYQLAQLLSVLRHAHKTVPFYRDRLKPVIEMAHKGLSMNMFRQIPILTRSDFQDAGDTIITTDLPKSHGPMYDIKTSGSTGQPLVIKGTDVTSMYFSALSLRYHMWHKRDFSCKSIHFMAMKPEETIVRKPAWGPAFNPGASLQVNHALPAEQLLDILIDEDPEYIQIHPSTLKEVLAYSIAKNLMPKKLREVRSRSEILYPELRDRVEAVWKVPVIDNYSCEELSIMALECPDNRYHYHVQSENCLIEVLRDDDTPCQPGEVGRTVISSLNNFATPLIRYENGDMAEVGEPCSCGRGLPIINRIVGRVRNVAILPNGERRTPVFSTEPILNELPIKHFQLIQKSYTDIEARFVVTRPLTGEEENNLATYFNGSLQADFTFTFVYPEEITRGANGKYEVFKCEVSA